MEERFIMIPNSIAEDNNLTASEKIIYGELFSLCKAGRCNYCIAGDKHLGKFLGGVKRSAVQKHLSSLEGKRYIKRHITYKNKNGDRGTWRTIYVCALCEEQCGEGDVCIFGLSGLDKTEQEGVDVLSGGDADETEQEDVYGF